MKFIVEKKDDENERLKEFEIFNYEKKQKRNIKLGEVYQQNGEIIREVLKMKNKCKNLVFFTFIFFYNFYFFASEKNPYFISGEMVVDASSKYEAAGFNFNLINRSEKNIKSFTVVFYIFDEDGNPPALGRNNIVVTINSEVLSQENYESCISLDSFLYEIPEEPYEVDYLYVSKIVYEDDSVWSDPFGLCAF